MSESGALPLSLAVKLGSLVVHAQEIDTTKPNVAYAFDLSAIESLAQDPEVAAWLDSFAPGLLPEKRSPQGSTREEATDG